jgi:hypothetical protein
MPRHARDPFAVAALIFSVLLVALLLFLLAAVARERARDRAERRFVPPGWTEPTFPPPAKPSEKTP